MKLSSQRHLQVETLREVNPMMFHPSRRADTPAECPEKLKIYCLEESCGGRCSGRGTNSIVQQEPKLKAESAAEYLKKLPNPTLKREKKRSETIQEQENEKSAREISCELMLRPSKRRAIAGVHQVDDDSPAWEPKVTADCLPCDISVPFTYICDRIYNLHEEKNPGYYVESRYEGRCYCRRLEDMLSVRFFH